MILTRKCIIIGFSYACKNDQKLYFRKQSNDTNKEIGNEMESRMGNSIITIIFFTTFWGVILLASFIGGAVTGIMYGYGVEVRSSEDTWGKGGGTPKCSEINATHCMPSQEELNKFNRLCQQVDKGDISYRLMYKSFDQAILRETLHAKSQSTQRNHTGSQIDPVM